MDEKVNLYFVTFGQNHPLRDGWVEIMAEDESTARELAYTVLGRWAMVYNSEKFFFGIDKYFPAGRYGQIIH